jgi:uncharacterized membrane protein
MRVRFVDRPDLLRRSMVLAQEETVASQSSASVAQQQFTSPVEGRARGRSGWRRALVALIAGAIALLPMAPAVLAAQTLSITTPYPSITVAPGAKVSIDLTIKTTDPANVALSTGGVPSGWQATLHGGGFIISAVQTEIQPALAGQESSPPTGLARLDVEVPASASNGSNKLTVRASTGGLTDTLTVEVIVSSTAAGNVTLTTDIPDRRGPSSSNYVFNLNLRNDSSEDITFTASGAGPAGWQIDSTIAGQAQAASAVLKAGSSNGITITVRPATAAPAGDYEVNVTVDTGDQTLTETLTIEITGTFTGTLTTPDGVLSTRGTAGGTIEQQLVLENTGTAELKDVSFNFSAATGWTVTFDPPTVDSIPAGGEVTTKASIVPNPDAIAGDYLITFRGSNDQITSTTEIRVTIETSPLWLIVGFALIVIVLGGLLWVFQRYGRR